MATTSLPPQPHMGLTCHDYDAVAAETGSDLIQLRQRLDRLTDLLDRTRDKVRTLQQENKTLTEQNDIMSDELDDALPYGALFTVPVSNDIVRTTWRELHPGSRGPVPAAATNSIAEHHDAFQSAIRATVATILANHPYQSATTPLPATVDPGELPAHRSPHRPGALPSRASLSR